MRAKRGFNIDKNKDKQAMAQVDPRELESIKSCYATSLQGTRKTMQ